MARLIDMLPGQLGGRISVTVVDDFSSQRKKRKRKKMNKIKKNKDIL